VAILRPARLGPPSLQSRSDETRLTSTWDVVTRPSHERISRPLGGISTGQTRNAMSAPSKHFKPAGTKRGPRGGGGRQGRVSRSHITGVLLLDRRDAREIISPRVSRGGGARDHAVECGPSGSKSDWGEIPGRPRGNLRASGDLGNRPPRSAPGAIHRPKKNPDCHSDEGKCVFRIF